MRQIANCFGKVSCVVLCLSWLLVISMQPVMGQSAFNVTNSSGTSRLYVKEDGKIGIGTTTPTTLLDLKGSGDPEFSIAEGVGTILRIRAGSSTGRIYTLTEDPISFGTYGANDRLYIDTNGSVGINRIPSSMFKLDVSGDIRCNDLDETSDGRLKQNISTIGNALEKILALRGVSHDWRTTEFPESNLPEGRQLGLIAQEVEAVLPEVVSLAPTYGTVEETGEIYQTGELYGISYGKIVPVLIEAMKQQQHLIDTQKQEVDDLKTRMAQVEAALQRLEQN